VGSAADGRHVPVESCTDTLSRRTRAQRRAAAAAAVADVKHQHPLPPPPQQRPTVTLQKDMPGAAGARVRVRFSDDLVAEHTSDEGEYEMTGDMDGAHLRYARKDLAPR